MRNILKGRRRVYIITNGCNRRCMDSARLKIYFKMNGCKIVKTARFADYIIFITCSFKKSKMDQCFKVIKELSRFKAELIVAGCLPDIAQDKLKQAFGGKVVETRNLDKLDGIFSDFNVKLSNIPDSNFDSQGILQKLFLYYELSGSFFRRCLSYLRERLYKIIDIVVSTKKLPIPGKVGDVFLRISYGCPENCSYCTILRAIGRLKSKKADECKREYIKLLGQGYRNFTFIADNLGAYGLDCHDTLEKLLQNLSSVDNGLSVKWNLNNLHPRWAIKYKDGLSKYISEGKIALIGCPIQSGSDRILRLMNRHHGIEEIANVLKEFKKIHPTLNLYTHFIVGFPSETEQEFMATINAVKDIGFDSALIFPYSDGCDSISSRMNEKIPEDIINERLKRAVNLLSRERITCKCDEA